MAGWIAAGLVSIAVGLAACSSGSPTGSAAAAGSQQPASPGLSCAWPTLMSVQVSNTLVPDSAAVYWLQPVAAGTDTRIVVAGSYPEARYASLTVYTPAGSLFTVNGVGSSLTDYRITPEPGSVNPWQQPAAPGGRFAVTLRSDVSAGQVNTLPLPPAKLYVLLLRNMLVSSQFMNSVQGVTQADDPAAAAAAMGAYYPRASVCPLATLAVQGAAACGRSR